MSTSRTFVIFLSHQGKASDLVALLNDEEHAALLAQNTDELYRLTDSEVVDLVVIDNQLPGFFSGIELVERMHAASIRPTTLLIAVANAKLNDRVSILPSARLISPSASVAEIAAIARTALMVRNIGRTPIHPKARLLVQDADVIRPLPPLVVKYANRLNEASCPIDELARAVSVDPRTEAMVLKLAKSAAFGVRGKVIDTLDAVTLLGIRRTAALLVSSSLVNAQFELGVGLPPTLQKWYFDRSMLISGAAIAFAPRSDDSTADTVYLLGLVQDLGVLIFASQYADAYSALVNRTRRVAHLRLEVAEHQEFGFTHAEVSAAVLSRWELPTALIKLIAHHHRSDCEAQMSPAEAHLLQLMRVGEAFANLADNRTAVRTQLLSQTIGRLGITSADEIKSRVSAALSRAAEFTKLMSAPNQTLPMHLRA